MSDVNVKDVIVRFWTSLHEGIFRATDGQVLNRVLDMPVVQLITIGRRSGEPRVTMLTAPVWDADRIVVVASNAGDYRHPGWYLNLLANPTVTVTMDGQTWTTQGEIPTPAERRELWPRVVQSNPGYAQYQSKTAREIPLVVLPRPRIDEPPGE
jgi:deazaflavin-dependent oxidoreductase (nitroreductase family)